MDASELDDNVPSLRNMVIGSVDTLTEKDLPTRIPPTWNDQPPLLRGPRGTPETTQLLKGVRHFFIILILFIRVSSTKLIIYSAPVS